MKFYRLTLVASIAVLGALACGQSVTGQWKGKLIIDDATMAKVKKMGQKVYEGAVKSVKDMKFTLTFNSAKTFKIQIAGGMGQMGPQNAEGTWKQKGSAITLHITKQNGKAPTGKNPDQTMTVSKDGKTLTMVPSGGGMPGQTPPKVVFTR